MKNANNMIELIKYGFWGGVTTVFNLVLFKLLLIVGINYIVANVLSYFVAVVVSYYCNKYLVFGRKEETNKSDAKEVGKYILVRIASIALDSLLLYIAVDVLGQNVMISKIVISVAIILGTYVMNKFWVFKNSMK